MVDGRDFQVHGDRDGGRGRRADGAAEVSAAEVLDQQQRRLLHPGRLPLAALHDHDRRVEVLLLLAERDLPQKNGLLRGENVESNHMYSYATVHYRLRAAFPRTAVLETNHRGK